jgi:hypothetical protein
MEILAIVYFIVFIVSIWGIRDSSFLGGAYHGAMLLLRYMERYQRLPTAEFLEKALYYQRPRKAEDIDLIIQGRFPKRSF